MTNTSKTHHGDGSITKYTDTAPDAVDVVAAIYTAIVFLASAGVIVWQTVWADPDLTASSLLGAFILFLAGVFGGASIRAIGSAHPKKDDE